jgi:ATP-binding cassette subfamily C protein
MLKLLRIFFTTPATNPALVLFCLVLAGFAEAVGISTLLPVVTNIAGASADASSGLGKTVNDVLEAAGLAPSLGNLVLLVIVLMVTKAALSFAALSYAGISSARVAISLRRRLIAAVFDARWSYFADQSGGRFANAIANDASRAGDAYLLAAQTAALVIQAIAYIAVAVAINWKLAALGITASIIIAIALRQLVRITRRAGYKQTDRTAALTVHMVDMLTNIKPLKSMHRHQPMLTAIATMLTKLKRTLVTRELSKFGLAQASDALVAIIAGAGIYFASTYANISLPELVVSGVVFFQVVSIASKIQKYLQMFVQYESAYVRLESMIRLAEHSRESNPGRAVPDISKGCRFENVTFAHAETPVITDVSFTIPHGAITVLSGASGSGKTTIIDLLIGLNRPDKGEIFVGQSPLGEIDLFAWRRMIGYVPQELNLFHASIRENITLGDPEIRDDAVLSALAQAGATEFLASLPHGLDTNAGELGSKFSGGQRQRISLARALVTHPKVLILDEVTSALDPRTESEIVENIAALRGAYTILAITHRPSWTRIADRLYRVSHGKVTEDRTRVARNPSRNLPADGAARRRAARR